MNVNREYKTPKHKRDQSAKSRQRIKADPERDAYWKEYHRQYRLKNGEKMKAQTAARQKKLLPEILMHRKGLSEIEKFYVTEHHGSCEICGGHPTGRTKRLSIDHNHDTGAFRGLLCGQCNSGLGMFKDNPDLLEKAIQYLNRKTLPGECQ